MDANPDTSRRKGRFSASRLRVAERFKPGDGFGHKAKGLGRMAACHGVRSFEEIGEILGISRASAENICREAEAKIATALAADLLDGTSGKGLFDGYFS